MDILDEKSDTELIRSAIGEIAKARNELLCARADVEKATGRLNFLLVLANKLIERLEIKR
jgi:hypothetical protein